MAESSGKKGGIFATALAGLGVALTHGADDCARFGARGAAIGGASVADDVARGAGHGLSGIGDDVLRGAGRGASEFGDDALRGAGRGAAATENGWIGAGRPGVLGERPPGGVSRGIGAAESEVGGARLVRDPVSAAAHEDDVLGELVQNGVDVSFQVLGPGEEESGGEEDQAVVRPVAVTRGKGGLSGARSVSSPGLVPVLPTTPAALTHVFGRTLPAGELDQLAQLALQKDPPLSVADLLVRLTERVKHAPIGILAYADVAATQGNALRLRLPDGGVVRDDAVHRICLKLGTVCVVLACDPAAGASCATVAHAVWRSASQGMSSGKMTVEGFARGLLDARGRVEGGRGLTLSRVDPSSEGPLRLVRSRPVADTVEQTHP